MPKPATDNLSRRERQIMNVLYRTGPASIAAIGAELPDPPSDTAIRTHMRILEDKGHVKRQRRGRKHVYRPTTPRKRAARAALSGVLATFFDGSLGDAVAAHLADPKARIDEEELERLRALVRDADRKRS
ncbi:MAG: BlaI/MecI/CopY family transcriptional regulator [Pseudomonadota bacterium]